jgi:hypothetical protein
MKEIFKFKVRDIRMNESGVRTSFEKIDGPEGLDLLPVLSATPGNERDVKPGQVVRITIETIRE